VEYGDAPPYREYDVRSVDSIPTDLPKHREEGLLLARPTWTGRTGSLVLAPGYPLGGIHGDHLLFTWSVNGRWFTLSLHGWPPLEESVATLRSIVASIDT
jgi:hypothetical protein